MKNRIRALITSALLTAVITLTLTPTAGAATDAERKRAGASTWTPRYMGFRSFVVDSSGAPFLIRKRYDFTQFLWLETVRELEGNWGPSRGLEFQAKVDKAYASEYDGDGDLIVVNVPAAAQPYVDTNFLDDFSGESKLGWGVGNASFFIPNVDYAGSIAVADVLSTEVPGTIFNATVSATATTLYDPPCSTSLKYCMFGDWQHNVLKTTTDRAYPDGEFANQLLWSTMGGGFEGAHGMDWWDWEGNVTQLCGQAANVAYDGDCIAQFNKGSGASSTMYTWVDLWDQRAEYTAEIALRCRKGSLLSGICPFRLSYVGFGGSADVEGYSLSDSIPNDGHWYLCRLDSEHPGPNGVDPFTQNHNSLKIQITNDSGETMEADFAFLGGRTGIADAEGEGPQPGPGNAPPGNNCTRMGDMA